jgi:hypothetical protein
MSEEKLEAWREIITTSAITSIALVKILTAKGLVNDSEILEAIEETKQELAARQP